MLLLIYIVSLVYIFLLTAGKLTAASNDTTKQIVGELERTIEKRRHNRVIVQPVSLGVNKFTIQYMLLLARGYLRETVLTFFP